jgi:carbonic anhydrase
MVDLLGTLPQNRDYYTYPGSLTTPPCCAVVTWLVMKSSVEMSSQQIGSFTALYPDNRRPAKAPSLDQPVKLVRVDVPLTAR